MLKQRYTIVLLKLRLQQAFRIILPIKGKLQSSTIPLLKVLFFLLLK